MPEQFLTEIIALEKDYLKAKQQAAQLFAQRTSLLAKVYALEQDNLILKQKCEQLQKQVQNGKDHLQTLQKQTESMREQMQMCSGLTDKLKGQLQVSWQDNARLKKQLDQWFSRQYLQKASDPSVVNQRQATADLQMEQTPIKSKNKLSFHKTKKIDKKRGNDREKLNVTYQDIKASFKQRGAQKSREVGKIRRLY